MPMAIELRQATVSGLNFPFNQFDRAQHACADANLSALRQEQRVIRVGKSRCRDHRKTPRFWREPENGAAQHAGKPQCRYRLVLRERQGRCDIYSMLPHNLRSRR